MVTLNNKFFGNYKIVTCKNAHYSLSTTSIWIILTHIFSSCFQAAAMDAVYPEPWSCLHRRPVRKQMRRGTAGRYRTQPVTFAEIKVILQPISGHCIDGLLSLLTIYTALLFQILWSNEIFKR
jgi:hypothetical protein